MSGCSCQDHDEWRVSIASPWNKYQVCLADLCRDGCQGLIAETAKWPDQMLEYIGLANISRQTLRVLETHAMKQHLLDLRVKVNYALVAELFFKLAADCSICRAGCCCLHPHFSMFIDWLPQKFIQPFAGSNGPYQAHPPPHAPAGCTYMHRLGRSVPSWLKNSRVSMSACCCRVHSTVWPRRTNIQKPTTHLQFPWPLCWCAKQIPGGL